MAADTADLQPSFRKAVEAMIAASGGRLYFTSGYRSDQQQAQLYAAAVQKYGAANAGRYVAPPGHSNHNRGLAADIGGDLDLLKQLAPQFGLELPMSWEPWHVEPVGLRTQSGTSAQAYPSSQPGTINPTQDTTLNSQPENLFATMSAILNGTMIANAAEGKMTGDTGVNQGMSGQQTGGGAGGGSTNVALQSPGTGGDKRIPGHSLTQWATDILNGLGAPITKANLDTLTTWANTESGGYNPNAPGGRYNPLNTTEGALGFAGQGGSQGDIKDYASYEQGVQNQIHNLLNTKGAGYEPIVAGLRAGNDPQAVFSAINHSSFGTHFS